ncbi:flavin monoamine oxidase family protein [Ningiella sp. W23]|uniref:flavin monoamine oxidase family protein n=1 Tax=Ningiella sp. W23 TaxID=3023715 RepID=UPI0037584826
MSNAKLNKPYIDASISILYPLCAIVLVFELNIEPSMFYVLASLPFAYIAIEYLFINRIINWLVAFFSLPLLLQAKQSMGMLPTFESYLPMSVAFDFVLIIIFGTICCRINICELFLKQWLLLENEYQDIQPALKHYDIEQGVALGLSILTITVLVCAGFYRVITPASNGDFSAGHSLSHAALMTLFLFYSLSASSLLIFIKSLKGLSTKLCRCSLTSEAVKHALSPFATSQWKSETTDLRTSLNDAGQKTVAIVGAGAAGMICAYQLQKKGYEVLLLEGTSKAGGRMEKNDQLADFPISLGAQWFSGEQADLQKFFIELGLDLGALPCAYPYKSNTKYLTYSRERTQEYILGSYKDKTFRNACWMSVFEEHVLPAINKCIYYETSVTSVDYTNEDVKLETTKGVFNADTVIITAPISILQQRILTFKPELPYYKRAALARLKYWKGIKVFMKFSNCFYPKFIENKDIRTIDGYAVFYDAAHEQTAQDHVLGFICAGSEEVVDQYSTAEPDSLIAKLLLQLDVLFDQKATKYFLSYELKDWSQEVHAQGVYVSDFANPLLVKLMSYPVKRTVFFAGDAYTNGFDWGYVHCAISSAINAADEVSELLNSK